MNIYRSLLKCLANILLLCVGLAAALLLAELAIGHIGGREIARLRWYDDHKVKLRRSENPEIMYEIVPGVGEANSQGLRDYEYDRQKSPGTYRIAVIGDSVAYGLGVEIKDSFPNQLEWMLNQKDPSRKHEVINFSVPGYSTIQEAGVLKYKALDYDPDMIIIAAFSNDNLVYTTNQVNELFSAAANAEEFKTSKILYDPELHPFKRWLLSTNLASFIRYRLALQKDRRIFQLPGIFPEEARGEEHIKTLSDYYQKTDIVGEGLDRIKQIIQKHQLPALVTYTPYTGMYRTFKVRGRALANYCRDRDLPYLDLTTVMIPPNRKNLHKVYLDTSHLTVLGNKRYAEHVYEKLKEFPDFAHLS